MIDLSSDTTTKPTLEMFAAMSRAKLGDEQRRDDPTVLELERRIATLTGKEAALLVPSATMANQLAIAIQCDAGGEVLCHRDSHVFNFEGGGLARNARAQTLPLTGEGGFFTASDVLAHLRPQDPKFPRTCVAVLENTTNLGGGRIWPDATWAEVTTTCHAQGISVHLDGARLWNAAVARRMPLEHWTTSVDTVQLCFSKGLGCPFGAVLASNRSTIEQARHIKQAMGGALRQAGVIAAAMLYALDHHVERLAEDHRRCSVLAAGLRSFPALELWEGDTNILYFQHTTEPSSSLARRLEESSVRVSQVGQRLRVCTHLDVDDADIEQALVVFRRVLCE